MEFRAFIEPQQGASYFDLKKSAVAESPVVGE